MRGEIVHFRVFDAGLRVELTVLLKLLFGVLQCVCRQTCVSIIGR